MDCVVARLGSPVTPIDEPLMLQGLLPQTTQSVTEKSGAEI